MTVLYTNDDPLPTVETVTETDDLFDPPDDDLSDGDKTEALASEYEGDLKKMPYRMLFGPKECRVKFTQPVDRKAFVRVCGNKFRASLEQATAWFRRKKGRRKVSTKRLVL
jgi:hypothetical protein